MSKPWQDVAKEELKRARLQADIHGTDECGTVTAHHKINPGLSLAQIRYRLGRVRAKLIQAGVDCTDHVRSFGGGWSQPSFGAQIVLYGWTEEHDRQEAACPSSGR